MTKIDVGSIHSALSLLVRIHTQDDELTGFVISKDAKPDKHEQLAYFEAWAAVRNILNINQEGDIKLERQS